jgi:large subunit ribosomal protein L9
MKIILRKDVPKLGEAGTVHTVADGFARNYLIPQGMAILATPGELKVVATNQKVADRKIARQEEAQQSLADKISGQRLTFTANTGEQGRLYGSITAADVADELSKAVGAEIDRRKVVLEDPIRSVGEHTVTVHLVGKLRPQVTVIVASDAVEEVVEATAEETPEENEDETAAPEAEEVPAEEA